MPGIKSRSVYIYILWRNRRRICSCSLSSATSRYLHPFLLSSSLFSQPSSRVKPPPTFGAHLATARSWRIFDRLTTRGFILVQSCPLRAQKSRGNLLVILKNNYNVSERIYQKNAAKEVSFLFFFLFFKKNNHSRSEGIMIGKFLPKSHRDSHDI